MRAEANCQARPHDWRLGVEYVPVQAAWPAANVLATIDYGESLATPGTAPSYLIGNRQLGSPLREVWTSDECVQFERHHEVMLGRTDSYLVGFAQTTALEPSIESATQALLRRLLDLMRERGYGHLMRVWNYIPDINRREGGLERYQRFCIGRHAAFVADGRNVEHEAPAASAVGHGEETLVIFFIATRNAFIAIENPRQVSAYRYPPAYGPRSPSFSRAVLSGDEHGAHAQLFVSGTASVVGHRSVHNDAAAQTEETLLNLRALIKRAQQQSRARIDWNDAATLKIYLRHAEDLPSVKEILQAALPQTPALFLEADICRRELRVEIEGIWNCG